MTSQSRSAQSRKTLSGVRTRARRTIAPMTANETAMRASRESGYHGTDGASA